MPIHHWTRVGAEIFHDFYHSWITAITHVLNQRHLPAEYYALTEQHGTGFEPDVLTRVAEPRVTIQAETDLDFYRRNQKLVAVRHASGDELVAVVEVLSMGN
jgi:hypothetical protein